MTAQLAATYNVVDIDTHIIEPPDLWTARMSKTIGEKLLAGAPPKLVA